MPPGNPLVGNALTLLAAFALAVVFTPAFGWLGRRLGLVDRPGGRRKHSGPVPRIGGIGLFAGFFLTALALFVLDPPAERFRPLLGVLVGTAFVFAAGLLDDRYELSAGPQFAAQFAAALIAIGTTVFIEEVTLPIVGFQSFPWYVTYPLTVLWIMGMMNTVNWLDGLDGLAAGVGAIAAMLFAIHLANEWGEHGLARYALALAGACLGFLLFNFFPARVFLGSAGAMTLGYALATLSILGVARVATALLVMAIPIADAAFQVFDRWRRGQSPTRGDRGHLHFRLMDLGLSQRQIVLGYWAFCAVFGGLALLIPARTFKLVALAVLALLVVAVLWALSRRQVPGPAASRQDSSASTPP